MRALFQIPRNPPPTLDRKDCPSLKQFISECLIKDFECRPTAQYLLSHPAMKKGAENAHQVRNFLSYFRCGNLFLKHSVFFFRGSFISRIRQ